MNIARKKAGNIDAFISFWQNVCGQFLQIIGAMAFGNFFRFSFVENLDHSYVNKFVRMTQLAPDIVQSILDGRQPQTLTLSQLMRPFPDGWSEQRSHFGFGN